MNHLRDKKPDDEKISDGSQNTNDGDVHTKQVVNIVWNSVKDICKEIVTQVMRTQDLSVRILLRRPVLGKITAVANWRCSKEHKSEI